MHPFRKEVFVFIVVLLGIGILFFVYNRHAPPPAWSPQPTPKSEAIVTVKSVHEAGEYFIVNALYPKFGIASVDARIEDAAMEEIALFKEAAKEYPPEIEGTPLYELAISFKVIQQSADLLSVELLISQYLGGAHGLTMVRGINVDPRTGKEFMLEDALGLIGLDLPEVSVRTIGQLKNVFGEDVIFEEGAAPSPENYSTFIVDDKNVTFLFQQYQVVAYAAGLPEATFPRVK